MHGAAGSGFVIGQAVVKRRRQARRNVIKRLVMPVIDLICVVHAARAMSKESTQFTRFNFAPSKYG
jgi:hypothetical protein